MQAGGRARWGSDTSLGSRLLGMFRDRGLVDLDLVGEVHGMRGDNQTGEWYYLGMEQAADASVENGVATREQIDGALALARSPEFVMMSPLSLSARGRKPA